MTPNELYGLEIRLTALRQRRDKAAAALQITEAELINGQVLRVKAIIAQAKASEPHP